MKTKIAKKWKDIFYHCQGNCRICFNEGGCKLQKFIIKYGLDEIANLVYNI